MGGVGVMKRDKLKDFLYLLRARGVATVKGKEAGSFRTYLKAEGVSFKETEVPGGYIQFRREQL